jgi:hypothetical protein
VAAGTERRRSRGMAGEEKAAGVAVAMAHYSLTGPWLTRKRSSWFDDQEKQHKHEFLVRSFGLVR